ncbi:hypothetical protein ATANTOWER_024213 [Ataeniobius toweri]|uniref:Uncharacterized protein n=1 Tax=Ataeniobius toweri TaxID=208326 RepID=A0ABU7C422_9TELE|nr:hypothetical protein [Ataeniobius toweri]
MKNVKIINLSLLLCPNPNLVWTMLRSCPGDAKFEESSVNKGLASSYPPEQWLGGPFCLLTTLHVTTVMRLLLSSFQTGKNSYTRLRRDRVTAGNSLQHTLLLQASERK